VLGTDSLAVVMLEGSINSDYHRAGLEKFMRDWFVGDMCFPGRTLAHTFMTKRSALRNNENNESKGMMEIKPRWEMQIRRLMRVGEG
jgi:hypothetical protein